MIEALITGLQDGQIKSILEKNACPDSVGGKGLRLLLSWHGLALY